MRFIIIICILFFGCAEQQDIPVKAKAKAKVDNRYEYIVEFKDRPEITIPVLGKKIVVTKKEIATDIPFQEGDENNGVNYYVVLLDNGDTIDCESIRNGSGNNIILEKIISCSYCGKDGGFYINRTITSWSNVYRIDHRTKEKDIE